MKFGRDLLLTVHRHGARGAPALFPAGDCDDEDQHAAAAVRGGVLLQQLPWRRYRRKYIRFVFMSVINRAMFVGVEGNWRGMRKFFG